MKKPLLILCNIILLSLGIFAQQFSSEWKDVPTTFTGLEIKGIHGKVLSATLKMVRKDEFQTTAAFEKRRADKSSISLGGKLTASDLLVFTYSPTPFSMLSRNGLLATYDADTETLKVQIKDIAMRYLGQDANRNIERRDYRGIEMSAAEITAKTEGFRETQTLTRYSIAVNNISQLISGRDSEMRADLKMPPNVARAAKENLSILVAGELAASYNGVVYDKY